jgi:hypothetical protein
MMRTIAALVAIGMVLVASMFAGLGTIVALDFMAQPLGWVGVTSPSTGWLVLGLVVGVAVGLYEGLRRAGRPIGRKKFGIGVVGVAAVLVIAGAAWQQSPAASATTVRVTSEGLNVRAEPENSSHVVGSVARGQVLEVLGISDDGGWYRVRAGGDRRVTGWVAARYVSTSGQR